MVTTCNLFIGLSDLGKGVADMFYVPIGFTPQPNKKACDFVIQCWNILSYLLNHIAI